MAFTIDDIKPVWIKEKTLREPAELPEEFYVKVARRVAELNRELSRGDELRRDLLREELNQILKMVQEIHLLRTLKVLVRIRREGQLPSSLLDLERYAFNEIRQNLEKLHHELVLQTIRGGVAIEAPPKAANRMLIVLAEIPQIVGDDMRQYGPFKKGEVACLAKLSAELLIKHDLARPIEVKVL